MSGPLDTAYQCSETISRRGRKDSHPLRVLHLE